MQISGMVLKFFHALIWLRALSIVAALGMASGASAYGIERGPTGLEVATAYALPDGTLPIICFGNGADTNSAAEHRCVDCCLSTYGFPNPTQSSYQVLRPESPARRLLFIAVVRSESPRLANSPTRGPPAG